MERWEKGQHGNDCQVKDCTSMRRRRGHTGKKMKEKEEEKGKEETSRMGKDHTGYKGLHKSHTCFPTHMNIDFMKLEGRLGASVT